MKKSVADIITEQIISKLEQGEIPWRKPWNGAALAPRNLTTGKPYRGINAFLLACAGFSSPYYLTFKQAQEKGGNIKAGSKGLPVVFWSTVEVEDRETGEEKEIPFMRYYTVFNIEQCEGIEAPVIVQLEREFNPIEEAERIISEMPRCPEIRTGNKASYSPVFDYVTVPKKELFHVDEAFYSTLFHELGHSTGHVSRLGRKGVTETSFFGSHEYSKEELVAEMTSAFLCGESGIIQSTIDNSAAYIQGWLKALKGKDNKGMVIWAAAQAQKATDFILNRKSEEIKEAA